MALDPLTATLGDRPTPDGATPGLIAEMLGAASAEIREAAGVPISETTSTVILFGTDSPWLTLPGGPVQSVSAVTVDGEAITDYRLVDGRLWRSCGWDSCEPVEISVTMVHGLAEVPLDIVALCRDLALAGINAALAGTGSRSGVQSEQESIDDYSHSTTYVTGDESTAGLMELPERTRLRLAQRFGGGAFVTGSR
jgi:hypothetical protein